MLQAVIFDLDDTLLDTSELLIPIAHTPQFAERVSRPLPLMPGALENLKYLQKKYELFLITLGKPEIQRQKIESLQISQFFREILVVKSGHQSDKSDFFQTVAERYRSQDSTLSIGNRRHTDIRLAKLRGLQTCLFDYGEHHSEQPEQPADHPDYLVRNHFELVRICRL